MLRFHIRVSTRDSALRRSIKRVMAATSSTADFANSLAELGAGRPGNLYVVDCRGENLTPTSWTKLPALSRILAIVDHDSVPNNAALLRDGRFTSVMSVGPGFDEDELIAVATKALRGDVFGLGKCFPWGVTMLSMVLKSYQDKFQAIDVLDKFAETAGCRGPVRDRIQTVCDELMTNALRHAPVDDEGKERYADRTPAQMSQITDLGPVEVQYGSSGRLFGVSVRDGYGSLSRGQVLQYLEQALKPVELETKASGAGLGLITVFRSASKLLFHSAPGESTEVVALFDLELISQGRWGTRSLHFFEAAREPDDRRSPTIRGRRSADRAEAAAAGTLPTTQNPWRFAAVAALGVVLGAGATAVAARKKADILWVHSDGPDPQVTLNGEPIPMGQDVELPPTKKRHVVVVREGHE